ncbi:MAG: substrate-binding domain-containing protein [Armatimonadetes bacterium]|nr:substrate-binding domain-containing protein [Armatimonadota bacterium]
MKVSVRIAFAWILAGLLVFEVSCARRARPQATEEPAPAGPSAKALPSTGAGGRSAPRLDGKKIGISLLTKQHIFYQDLERGFRDAANRLGAELIIVSSEFDPKLQDDQVDDFIVQKVDAIVLCPADSASVGGAVKKANAAGIPVFTADIAAKEGEVVCHIASDNVQGGRLAASYLAKALGDSGKVVIIDHPVVTSVQERVAGFEEEMKKHPGIKIVAKQPAEGQRAKARQVMEDMLLAHPDLDGVFGINDDSALGALAACRAHKGAEKVVIVGYDATPEAVQEILAGSQLKADVVQHPYRMGTTTIEAIARYFAGEKLPKFIPIAVDIVDKQRLEQLKAKGKLKQVGGQWALVEE